MKTYGSELVERLGARTQEVTEAMRNYVDSFDTRVTTKSTEVTAALDQRLVRFQEALDSRTQTLNDALSSRVMDIAKTLAEGGKEVVTALDKRISDVTGVINTRGAKLAETVGEQHRRHRQGARHARASRSPTTLDTRIGQLEQLLVGRAEARDRTDRDAHPRRRRPAQRPDRGAFHLDQDQLRWTSSSTLAQLTRQRRRQMLRQPNTAASVAATEVLNRSAAEATVVAQSAARAR